MNEMVERIAQVLAPHFSGADRAYKEHYKAAREVIVAMRESGIGCCPKCHMEFLDVHSVRCVHRGEYGCCDVSPGTTDKRA